MLQANDDTYFDQVLLPVDVFHFKAKHKETDTFCQENCNPAAWKELFDKDGNWRFNSSAAEQANAWIGNFISIVLEMLAHRFNFFIDEMIQGRNRDTVGRLAEDGYRPWNAPFVR